MKKPVNKFIGFIVAGLNKLVSAFSDLGIFLGVALGLLGFILAPVLIGLLYEPFQTAGIVLMFPWIWFLGFLQHRRQMKKKAEIAKAQALRKKNAPK